MLENGFALQKIIGTTRFWAFDNQSIFGGVWAHWLCIYFPILALANQTIMPDPVTVKVTLVNKEVVEGTVWCLDPISDALVMKVKDQYVLVNAESIVDIDGDLSKVKPPNPKEIGMTIVPVEKWPKKEMEALMHAEGEMDSVNFQVNSEAQSLFDRLRNIFPCKWMGKDMLIFENIKISPPYDTPKAIGGNDDGLDRISKVLEGERRKLNL